MRGNEGGLAVGEARCEVEGDKKEVDGVEHAEGDVVDDQKRKMTDNRRAHYNIMKQYL